jgi:hypothetical protein
MSSGRSLYHRRPKRYAEERKEFQRLIARLKSLALKRGYTKNQIATELGGVGYLCLSVSYGVGGTLFAHLSGRFRGKLTLTSVTHSASKIGRTQRV